MNNNPYPKDSLARLQSAELELLKIIDTFCRENEIDYFIEGGTCLGAIRHGGFIPWDDDVDLGMPKKDYDRFCKLAKDGLPEGYSIHTSLDTPGHSALWAKVFKDGTRFIDDNADEAGCEQGIFIDIFSYCQLDEDERIAKKQCVRARSSQVLSYLKHFSRPKIPDSTPFKLLVSLGCKFLHHAIRRTISQERLQERFDHAFESDAPGEKWICAAYTESGVHKGQTLFPTQDIEFEGITLRGPHDCETYLSTMYGDFNELPPLNKRYTHAPKILDFGDGVNVIEED